MVDPGNLVHANDAGGIMTITQVRPIAVVFTLPQRNLPPIVEEMTKGPVTVAAWSGEDNRELAQGTLLTPDNAIDATTGTIRLKATFPNEENRLWPGQFVEARLLLRTEHQVVAVPTQAVQHGQGGLYVYIVKPDSTVQRQTVVAEDRGPVMVITKGLDAGQAIVLDGQSRLQDGMLVAATAPLASTSAAERASGGNQRRMSISTPFIQRPIATSLVMAALVLVGIAAYPLLPVAPLPRVDFPTIVVSGSLPGASPETMAATVAQPLETQIAQIPGVAPAHLGERPGQHERDGAVRPRIATSMARPATSRRRSRPPAGSCRRSCRDRRPTGR